MGGEAAAAPPPSLWPASAARPAAVLRQHPPPRPPRCGCCCPFADFVRRCCSRAPRRVRKGRADAEDLLARKRKYGSGELQELLEESRVFVSARLQQYVAAAGAGGGESPDSGEPDADARPRAGSAIGRLGGGGRRGSGGRLTDRVIDNYLDLDALGSADALLDHTLVVKGPLRIDDADGAAEALAWLESLLLDETDPARVRVRGVRIADLEVTPAVAAWLGALLGGGGVDALCFAACAVDPLSIAPGGALRLERHGTLRHLAFRGCSLSDAHLKAFVSALRGAPLLDGLESLTLTGGFGENAMQGLLGLLACDCPGLRALSLPRRHEALVKRHPICDDRPHLTLNGKKVRHRLIA